MTLEELEKEKKKIEKELIQKIEKYGIRPLARETKLNNNIFNRIKKKKNNFNFETLLKYKEKFLIAENKIKKH